MTLSRYSALTAVALFSFALAAPAHAATLEVSGWIPYWRTATGTADALSHLNSFTEINPFVLTMKTDGTINDAGGLDSDPWTSLIAAAKAKKIRIIPSIMWSDTENIHKILSNTSSRIALEDRITALVKEEGWDGIDIDFENKYAEDKNYFSTFLRGLYQRMGNKWVTCTIEARTPVSSRYDGTPPKDATTYANDYTQINKYCDRVRLMAYDQGSIDVKLNAEQSGPYVPVADPQWVEKVVKLAAQSIAKRKLVLGIPTYGYEYELIPLSQQGYRYNLLWAFNPKYATDLATSLHLTPTRNSAGEMSFVYIPTVATLSTAGDTTTPDMGLVPQAQAAVVPPPATSQLNIAWWSDAQAVADKVALAKKLGIRGVAIFKVDGGEDQGIWSVLPKQH